MTRPPDAHLLQALTNAYTARAKLFHAKLAAANVDLLIAEIDAIDEAALEWDADHLAISASALRRVREAGEPLHRIFAHPDVLSSRLHLLAYYRNIVTVSKKGIAQLLFSTDSLEERRTTAIHPGKLLLLCRTFNRIISGVIDALPGYTVDLSRQAILAEIGAELQGAWVNVVGQGATKAVQKLLADHVTEHHIGRPVDRATLQLDNGWVIRFGTEPDVAFLDRAGVTRIAIEVKGSLDRAGAQTRYGEAKKSFAKQLAENPRCHTIYLASCYTDAVIEQIETDDQVRQWFNLTSILYDPREKTHFLRSVFHIVDAPTR